MYHFQYHYSNCQKVIHKYEWATKNIIVWFSYIAIEYQVDFGQDLSMGGTNRTKCTEGNVTHRSPRSLGHTGKDS